MAEANHPGTPKTGKMGPAATVEGEDELVEDELLRVEDCSVNVVERLVCVVC